MTNIIQTHLPNSLAKLRLKLEKVGTTTRPFSYDLSQIPYNHTGEVTNRFKGLDLLDRVPKEVWTEVHDIVQKAGIKMIPKKKKCKKHKMVVWEGLTNSWKKKRSENQRRKGKISSAQFSSVTQSCPTLCDPMNCSTPDLPVHHHLPEFTQTHVHWVSDAIQPSHPLSSPSPPAPNPSQHQSLFQWVNSSHEVAKVLEFQL